MTDLEAIKPERVAVKPALALQFATGCGTDPKEIADAMGQAFGVLQQFAQEHAVQFAGPPRSIYTGYGEGGTEFIVAMPIAGAPSGAGGEGPVEVGEIPGGNALRFVHKGPYPQLMETYEKITAWMKAEGMIESDADWAKYMPMWEEYVNDPMSTPEAELITQIYLPLR
jgi:effector-binding domain-containing protein